MKTLADRVNQRLRDLGSNGNKLAKKMDLPYGTIQSVTSGRSKTFRYMTELAEALETTTEWLLTGKGTSSATAPSSAHKLHEFLIAGITADRKITPEAQHMLEQHLSFAIDYDAKNEGIKTPEKYVDIALAFLNSQKKEKTK